MLFGITSMHNKKITVDVNAIYKGKASTGLEIFNSWKYDISVKNQGSSPVQIIGRYWNIIDSNGFSKEVSGDDVVGQQPIITPGNSFFYSSYANLKTESGIMRGKYKLKDLESNSDFEVTIPAFSLDSSGVNILYN